MPGYTHQYNAYTMGSWPPLPRPWPEMPWAEAEKPQPPPAQTKWDANHTDAGGKREKRRHKKERKKEREREYKQDKDREKDKDKDKDAKGAEDSKTLDLDTRIAMLLKGKTANAPSFLSFPDSDEETKKSPHIPTSIDSDDGNLHLFIFISGIISVIRCKSEVICVFCLFVSLSRGNYLSYQLESL